jgi:hypothetical protein
MSEDENPVVQSLVRLSESATESGLSEYLLDGGNAVIAYGVPRFTRDLDFVIPDREQNDWRRFLEANGFQFVHGTPAFVQFQDRVIGRPRVDLMLVGESTWSQLESMARVFELTDEISIPIVSPEHLIAMKLRACLSPQRHAGAVDWSDIVELCIRNKFDPQNDAAFAQLVIQFGNASLLQKLIDEIASRGHAY